MRLLIAACLFVALGLGPALPTALAKGSCCAPPPKLIEVIGSPDFGVTHPFHTSTITLSIVAENTSVATIAVTPGGPFALASTTCAGSRTCTATFSFTPDKGGDYVGSAVVTGAGARATITLAGHGYGPSYAWQGALPYSIVNGTQGSAQVLIRSTGETPLVVRRFLLRGVGAGQATPEGDIVLGKTTCTGRRIFPGTSCTLDILYDAAQLESDSYFIRGSIIPLTNSATDSAEPVDISVTPSPDGGGGT